MRKKNVNRILNSLAENYEEIMRVLRDILEKIEQAKKEVERSLYV